MNQVKEIFSAAVIINNKSDVPPDLLVSLLANICQTKFSRPSGPGLFDRDLVTLLAASSIGGQVAALTLLRKSLIHCFSLLIFTATDKGLVRHNFVAGNRQIKIYKVYTDKLSTLLFPK